MKFWVLKKEMGEREKKLGVREKRFNVCSWKFRRIGERGLGKSSVLRDNGWEFFKIDERILSYLLKEYFEFELG